MNRQLDLLLFLLTASIPLAVCPVAHAEDDLADVRGKRFTLEADRKLRYVLIGSAEKVEMPEDGYKVLVVLPGGDGGADFTPFVKRIYKYGLDESWLVVQLIAPKWKAGQKITWPITTNPVPRMKVGVDEFARLAVEDVDRRTRLNESAIFALGWSSGGPAAYAATLAEDSPIRGAFAAMSVFRDRWQPPLAGAAGKAFYIWHSPDDRVCPYRMAKTASEQLAESGGKTTLVDYAGGHGWCGEVFGTIRTGANWLVENASAPPSGAPAEGIQGD